MAVGAREGARKDGNMSDNPEVLSLTAPDGGATLKVLALDEEGWLGLRWDDPPVDCGIDLDVEDARNLVTALQNFIDAQ